jgi:hypothetical protein
MSTTPHTTDSPAISLAKSIADASDYVREHGPDETLWTHMLSWSNVAPIATSEDYATAFELIQRVAPEARRFIAHLETMRDILAEGERYRMKFAERNQYATPIGPAMAAPDAASAIRARRSAARAKLMGEPSPSREPRSDDMITARFCGQYITLQRCEWSAIAQADADMLARAEEISNRPADNTDAR